MAMQLYNVVPPPAVGGDDVGLRLRKPKFIKKISRGVSKVTRKVTPKPIRGIVRKVGKVAKKVGRIALTPQRLALKYGLKGLKAMGKFAAKPIRAMYRKIALRRAKYLSWHNRKSLQPNPAEKAKGGQYAVAKMGRNPLGKLGVAILKATWGTSVSGCDACAKEGLREAAALGMTGAEIAAAAASIVTALVALMKSLNKPGEAPADPTTEPSRAEASEAPAADPVEAPAEDPADEPTEDTSGATPAAAPVKVNVMPSAKVVAALVKGGMTKTPVKVIAFKPTRFVTLEEVEGFLRKIRADRGANRKALQDELVRRLYAKGVGIVPDVNALPASELALRKAGGALKLAGIGALPDGARGYAPYTWITRQQAEALVNAYMGPGTMKQRWLGKAGLNRADAEAAVLRDLRAKKIGIRTS